MSFSSEAVIHTLYLQNLIKLLTLILSLQRSLTHLIARGIRHYFGIKSMELTAAMLRVWLSTNSLHLLPTKRADEILTWSLINNVMDVESVMHWRNQPAISSLIVISGAALFKTSVDKWPGIVHYLCQGQYHQLLCKMIVVIVHWTSGAGKHPFCVVTWYIHCGTLSNMCHSFI